MCRVASAELVRIVDVSMTKPGGDGRTRPPDSPPLVGPHKGGLLDPAPPPLPIWDLPYMKENLAVGSLLIDIDPFLCVSVRSSTS